MSVSPRAVEFLTISGRRLIYSVGETSDAAGSSVDVVLSVRDRRLVLTLGDSGTVYPVTVKNLLSGIADTVLEGNVADILFPGEVVSGDVNGDGFADVLARARLWDGGQTGEGAIFVFHGGPDGIDSNGSVSLSIAANAVIESNVAGLNWPGSIGVVGDSNGDGYDDFAAGDPRWDPVNPPSTSGWFGAVCVFEGSASGITATSLDDADARIVSDVLGAEFGWTVKSAGDVNGDGFADMIALAYKWSDDAAQADEGAVFVFLGSAGGFTASTINDADTVLEGNQASAMVGWGAGGVGDLDGDGFDDFWLPLPNHQDGQLKEGAVAVFYGSASGVVGNPTQTLADRADTLIQGNETDMTLAGPAAAATDVNGDGYADLVLGYGEWSDEPGLSGEGALLVFHGGPAGIEANPSEPAVDAADTVIEGNPNPTPYSMQLGINVISAGDVNGDGYGDIVATSNFFSHPEISEGGVFVFKGREGGIPSSRVLPVEDVADFVIEGNTPGLLLGQEQFDSGDVNGDGFTDLLLETGFFSNGQHNEGAIFIYHGAAEMLSDEPDDHHDETVADTLLGLHVASVGDLNGDGYSDFAVGAPLYDGGSMWEGKVHVFFGGSHPSLTVPDWTFEGQYWMGETGWSVASAGDLNGDGFGDLVIATPNLNNPEISEGRVDVFYGSAAGLPTSADWYFESDVDNAQLGTQVASAGDIDADGYGDLIIGAPGYSDGQYSEGRAYVFFGSSLGLSSSPGWTYESDVAQARFGNSVASAGDVDGNGFGDVIIGAPGYESGQTGEGAAFGFPGGPTGLPDTPNWFIQTNRTNTNYGGSLAAAGDVNGDGFGDVVVGAATDTNGEASEGRAYVYHGHASGLSTAADRVLEQNIANAAFGSDVAGAGDVNGDGYADLVVGSPYVGFPSFDGRAYLYLGTAAGVATVPAWFIERPGAADQLGTAVAGIGDFNGDGFSDVVIGVPGSDAGAVDGGSVELYLGNAGSGRPVLARQMRGDGDPTPVQPWGLTHSGDAFTVAMTATSPRGRELVKLHVEACPPGEPFGDVDCRHAVSEDWTAIPLGENGVVLTEAISGLTEGELYRWRAHVLYVPLHADEPGITTPPVPRHGPWRTLFAQRPAADIRVGVPQQITLELVSSSSSVSEGAVQVEVNAVVTTSDGEPTEVDCEADFETFNGTAFAGVDFVSTSGNAFFYAGTASGTAQILPVGLTDDALDEPDEYFLVEISNPTGAILGPQTVHTVTILDDDPPPDLSAVDIGIDEGAGPAVVQLELSAPTTFEVTVAYGTVDGSAVAPFDFIHVGGTALIPPMDTIFNVEIPIENDWLEEGEESFTLDLWSPSNAALVTSAVTVTIFDNDAGILFADGFEIGDTTEWSWTVP